MQLALTRKVEKERTLNHKTDKLDGDLDAEAFQITQTSLDHR
jgi:hypothetical protein